MKKTLLLLIASTLLLTGCLSSKSPEVYIAHILVACPVNAPADKVQKAARKLYFAKVAIDQDAVTFRQAVIENSDCPSKNGNPEEKLAPGALGWINIEQAKLSESYPANFIAIAEALKPGEISSIFRTKYGFHILKCYGRR